MKRTILVFAMIAALSILSACGTSKTDVPASSAASNQSSMMAHSSANTADSAAQTPVSNGETPEVQSNAESAAAQSGVKGEQFIGEEEARRIALEDAGVLEADVTGIHIRLERDDGVDEYEVEFYVGTEEYDYDINAVDGTIRSKDRENEFMLPDSARSGDTTAAFSEADAIALVLNKVPGATEDLIRIHLDKDDGMLIYEGSLYYEGMEYDFEINAQTGEIREWEAEREHHD